MLDFLLGLGVLAAVYGTISISLNLQAGTTGLVNFGQVAFVGIGAYSVAISAEHGLPWPAGFAIGAGLAALAGAAIGRLGRTLAADYWAIATLALAELLRLVALNQDGLTGGAQGISDVPGLWAGLTGTAGDLAALATTLVVLLVAWMVARLLTRGQFGRVLRLVRENPNLAASLGHDVVDAKVRVLAVGGAMAAISGGVYAKYISYIGPSELIPFETFLVFTMIVLGGMGNVSGAVAGALLVQLLYDGSRFMDSILNVTPDQVAGIRLLLVGAVLLGCLLVRPSGLLPERMRSFDVGR